MTEQRNEPAQDTEESGWPLVLSDQGCFYVGGRYNDDTDTMTGQVFVQYQRPADLRYPFPVIMIHGGGQTGAGFLSTPDGRRGWADNFVAHGFAVYVVDAPGRGRAQGHDQVGAVRPATAVAGRVCADGSAPAWPQAHLHSQWPGEGNRGDPTFDQFYASQVSSSVDAASVERAMRDAGAALLDKIGPAVLLTHSLGAPFGWQIGDARPDLTRAIVAIEPNGPPVYDVRFTPEPDWFDDADLARPWGVTRAPITYSPPAESADELSFERQERADGPGFVRYWRQAEPARRLPNLARLRILIVSGEASYHAPYDHATSAYFAQAGVEHDFIRLAERGIHGNGHMMMLEKNSADIARLLREWILATSA
ncbi:alpha/beta hydrolase [Rhodococcus sp. LB1]|uniref:alpha/beta hydrolase n=1 Tax=Rhodococcus sp. LB1 TaxID=1807499 RepID=UPI0009EC07EC